MNPSTTTIIVNLSPEQVLLLIGSINSATWSIVGTLWALIFAVTWKG